MTAFLPLSGCFSFSAAENFDKARAKEKQKTMMAQARVHVCPSVNHVFDYPFVHDRSFHCSVDEYIIVILSNNGG